MRSGFMPGIELCRSFHDEAVRPLLARAYPRLTYSAALVGPGSDVLGFDTARSTDHDWGPRLHLFLSAADHEALASAVDDLLARHLPPTFAGFSTHFEQAGDGVFLRVPAGGPVRHRVVVTEPTRWYRHWLGFLPWQPIGVLDWLATPTQVLLEQTAGAVYHDGLGVLAPARTALAWYPDEVWRYLLACHWQRIGQEEPFVGRSTELGDEWGAAVLTARLVRDLGRLHLLMARRYPPYSKWLGTAVARLPGVAEPLTAALQAPAGTREEYLCRAYQQAATAHNTLGLTPPVDTATRDFHDRPYRVLGAHRFADALRSGITDPEIAGLPLVGAVDQIADSTDFVGQVTRRRAATAAALGLTRPAAADPADLGPIHTRASRPTSARPTRVRSQPPPLT